METLKKTNLSDAVAERLLALISKGEFPAGGKLPSESRLCEMLGVSRTSVREGIKALAGLNALTVFPGRGTYVNENQDVMVNDAALHIAISRETVHDIYEVRSVMDAGVAKYAALKATEADMEALHKAINKMEKSIGPDGIDEQMALEGDEEFNAALCEAAHNRLLENIARPIINHAILRIRKQRGFQVDPLRAAIEDHRKILEGIKRRNVGMALDAVEKHLAKFFKTVYGDE